MNFRNMLVMCGPAGVECEHSIVVVDEKTGTERIINNHWLKNSTGVFIARGADYIDDYEVGQQEQYERGELSPPHLMTVQQGKIVRADITGDLIADDWVVASHDEVGQLFT